MPPIWLGLLSGWIVGSWAVYIKLLGGVHELFILSIPLLIIILGNIKTSRSKKCNRLKENNLNQNKSSLDIKKITTYETLKNWFLQEQSSTNTIDLTGAIDKSRQVGNLLKETKGRLRIGVVGEFGTGKSTLIDFILHNLKDTRLDKELIVCKVSMWGCHTSIAAQELILQGIVDEIGCYFDNSFCSSITNDWKTIVEGSGFGWSKWLQFFWPNQTIEQTLYDLSKVLNRLNSHLVLIIEDIDRKNDQDYDARQVQALLERLKLALDCSIIVAGKADAIDFSRFCEVLVTPPIISPYTLQTMISISTRSHIPKAFDNWSNTHAISWSLLYGNNRSKNSIGSAAATLEIFSILDFQHLVGTPRLLKHFFRRLDSGWMQLSGEVNYFDFFLITLLRISLPDSFDFIHTHHEILQNPPNPEVKRIQKNLPARWEALKDLFKEHREKLDSKSLCFDKIIALLFGKDVCHELGISVELNALSWPTREKQRIAQKPFPTNYWNRVYSESVESTEIKDQKIISAHEKWLAQNEDSNELILLLRDDLANLKWVDLKLQEKLSDNETFRIIKELLVDRCVDLSGTPLTVAFIPLAEMSARSALMVLEESVQRQTIRNSDAFWDWAISTFSDLRIKNLHTAALFIQGFVIGNQDNQNELTLERYRKLKAVLSASLESPDQLFSLIPKDSYHTLTLYLLLLSFADSDLQSPNKFFREHYQKNLTIPQWIKDSWVQAILNESTQKQALLQAVYILFHPSFEAEHAQSIQLLEARINAIFGTHGRQIIELIAAVDLSAELPIETLKKIQEEANGWLSKSKRQNPNKEEFINSSCSMPQ